MAPRPIVGVLLAAGSAKRFGADKLRVALPDGTAIGVAALKSLAAAVDAVVAVVRPGDDVLARELDSNGARVTFCPVARDGMGSSLAWGVRAAPLAAAWVIALADMPWVRAASVARVVAALRGGAAIAAPSHNGAHGHPVGFASGFYAELSSLSGDEGAKGILARGPVTLIAIDDPGVVRDVDVPEDLM